MASYTFVLSTLFLCLMLPVNLLADKPLPLPLDCYNCVSLCYESKDAELKGLLGNLNQFCSEACAAPKPENAANFKECGQGPCFTVMGSVKIQVELKGEKRNLILKINRRDCMPHCPNPGVPCSLMDIDKCGYNQQITDEIKKQVGNVEKDVPSMLANGLKVEPGKVTIVSRGGEITCCQGDKCNNEDKAAIADLHLKDEL